MKRMQILPFVIVSLMLLSCSKYKMEEGEITQEVIYSLIVKDEYKLFFYLPGDYDSIKSYPIVYLLDGDWHTERMAWEITRLLEEDQIPPCILVGIGNSEERIRDYTYPPDEENEGSGHADDFYSFLQDELLPDVEARYSIDPARRILAGHSLGGFMSLYALFQGEGDTPLFSGIIAASPSIWWEDAYLLTLEKEYAQSHSDLQASLFLSAGSDEGVTNMLNLELRERLVDREYKGFTSQRLNFKNKAHEGAAIPGFIEGLIFTLNQ